MYVNAVGTREDRALSQEQIDWGTQFYQSKQNENVFVVLDQQTVRETPYVKPESPSSFAEACRWIAGSASVITLDSAVVHAQAITVSRNWHFSQAFLLSVSVV